MDFDYDVDPFPCTDNDENEDPTDDGVVRIPDRETRVKQYAENRRLRALAAAAAAAAAVALTKIATPANFSSDEVETACVLSARLPCKRKARKDAEIRTHLFYVERIHRISRDETRCQVEWTVARDVPVYVVDKFRPFVESFISVEGVGDDAVFDLKWKREWIAMDQIREQVPELLHEFLARSKPTKRRRL